MSTSNYVATVQTEIDPDGVVLYSGAVVSTAALYQALYELDPEWGVQVVWRCGHGHTFKAAALACADDYLPGGKGSEEFGFFPSAEAAPTERYGQPAPLLWGAILNGAQYGCFECGRGAVTILKHRDHTYTAACAQHTVPRRRESSGAKDESEVVTMVDILDGVRSVLG